MRGTATALCAAITIDDANGAVPEWLHLVPAGEVRTQDGRGPYRVKDPAALIQTSIAAGKLVVDENHATDLAAPKGLAAPARGWIVELQHRSDGIWGRVEWTEAGRQIMERKEYRGVSPVITHWPDGTIAGILRASLTNTPNFTGLTALHHQENSMDLRARVIEALGLDADADDEAIIAAIKKLTGGGAVQAALQSALAPIAQAIGLQADATASAVLAGVQQLQTGGDAGVVAALQSELADTAHRLNQLIEDKSRTAATAFVDGAIAAGRVGVKPMRDRYISMHMADPAGTEELISALPVVKGGPTIGGAASSAAAGGLGAADTQVIQLMGVDPKAYAATLAELRGETIA